MALLFIFLVLLRIFLFEMKKESFFDGFGLEACMVNSNKIEIFARIDVGHYGIGTNALIFTNPITDTS